MSTSSADGIAVQRPAGALETSAVVTAVLAAIIDGIDGGTLLPGDRLSDARLAEQLGVSRTPVREAFQRLREVGIVEASASRFTRVSVIGPRQTAHTLVVWLAVFDALLTEVVPTAPPELYASMVEFHDQFTVAAKSNDGLSIASANVAFYNAATAYSANPQLQYTLNTSIQLVRLGGLRLRGVIDFQLIVRSQAMLLSAVRARNVERAHESVRLLHGLHIPGSDTPE